MTFWSHKRARLTLVHFIRFKLHFIPFPIAMVFQPAKNDARSITKCMANLPLSESAFCTAQRC